MDGQMDRLMEWVYGWVDGLMGQLVHGCVGG